MKCPKCGKELRKSKKDSDRLLCDNCRKGYWREDLEDDYDDDYEDGYSRKSGKPSKSGKKKGGALKIVLIVIAVLIVIGIIGAALGGGETDTSINDNTAADTNSGEQQAQEAETESDTSEDDGVINFDGNGYNVTYVKHETGTDYEGNPCLYYYHTFTNNGEENTSAAVATYIQCFQNGTQCQTAITTDSNDSINNYMMEVQPGGSIEVCQVYALTDTSDVTIEASDLISLSDEKDTQVITLQ